LAPIREDAQLLQREIQVDRDEPDDGACIRRADPDHGDVRGRGAGVGIEEAGLRTDIAASGISCCRTRMPGATWLKW
jgi:hypothetical protein